MAVETLNMLSVSIRQFIEEVDNQMDENNFDPMVGIGKSGVGKTMSIAELCKKRGIGFCELRLVTLTEVDMLGIPVIEDGRTTYASNALLPDEKRDGEVGILVLDEITSATPTVRAAAYQLLDSKRSLGNYKLPPKWKVVALGNGPSDGGVFQGMEAAFLSRCMCYRIEPNLEVWKTWAMQHDVNPAIPAFLTFAPDYFHMLPDEDEFASIFPCPRSWMALSKVLNAREKKSGGVLKNESVRMLTAGAVGFKVSDKFTTFYAFNEKVKINPEDVINGKAVKSVGDVGNRKFTSIYNIATIENQVMLLTIQSVVKGLIPYLDKFDVMNPESKESEQAMRAIANCYAWGIAISDTSKDYATKLIQEIIHSHQSAQDIVLDPRGIFDGILPEFMLFCQENERIFSVN